MKKGSNVFCFQRGPKHRAKSSSAKFVGTVIVVAGTAFIATLMWPRPADLVSAEMSGPADDFACDVAFVNDGDTLRCQDGTRVRLHAIAARKSDGSCSPGHPCPAVSTAMSRAALTELAGRRITCIQIGTNYERVTASCRNALRG